MNGGRGDTEVGATGGRTAFGPVGAEMSKRGACGGLGDIGCAKCGSACLVAPGEGGIEEGG